MDRGAYGDQGGAAVHGVAKLGMTERLTDRQIRVGCKPGPSMLVYENSHSCKPALALQQAGVRGSPFTECWEDQS